MRSARSAFADASMRDASLGPCRTRRTPGPRQFARAFGGAWRRSPILAAAADFAVSTIPPFGFSARFVEMTAATDRSNEIQCDNCA